MLEAELAVRNVFVCQGQYIGLASSSAYRKNTYKSNRSLQNSTSELSVDYDCKDFSSAARAQRFFLASGGPLLDPHNFDSDGDGLACEWGAEARRISTGKRSTPTKSRKTSYSSYSKCYVGPRGGTYTITASGRKNYDGC